MLKKNLNKAELMEYASNLEGALSAAELARDEARGANNHLNKDLADSAKRNDGMRARIDGLLEEQARLQAQVRRLEEEFRDMNKDRDNWKKHFLEEQAANRKSKELLVRQAHLAGELAQMVTPANLRNI